MRIYQLYYNDTVIWLCICFLQIFSAASLFLDVVFVFLLQSNSLFSVLKLVIYAGPNTNSRKVAEYGGNTLGYGSRSVLGTGWPKDLVKVWYQVTTSFQKRKVTILHGPRTNCNPRKLLPWRLQLVRVVPGCQTYNFPISLQNYPHFAFRTSDPCPCQRVNPSTGFFVVSSYHSYYLPLGVGLLVLPRFLLWTRITLCCNLKLLS